MKRRWLLQLVFGALLLLATQGRARAHDPFEITTVGTVFENRLELVVTMNRSSALRLLQGTSVSALRAAPSSWPPPEHAIDALALELFGVTSQGRELRLVADRHALNADAELEFRLEFAEPAPGQLRLDAKHLRKLPDGYMNAVALRQGPSGVSLGHKFLHAGDSAFEVMLAQPGISPEPRALPEAEAQTKRLSSFLELGIEHVLTGYDHLLFLAGILVAARRVRTLVGLITSFTIAHSVTLLWSTLAQVSVPANIVEPFIAASIVFVGVENLITREKPRARTALTFVFGLVHGLGFASGLRELGLDGSTALPLFAFNFGVEIGQITAAVLFFPIVVLAREHNWGPRLANAVSLGVSAAGAYWVIERTLFA